MKISRRHLTLLLVLLAAVVAFLKERQGGPGAPLPAEVSGRIRGIDGDSFRLGADEVRLVGIDAPEGRQDCERGGARWACGEEAARRLGSLVGNREVKCRIEDRDQYGRLLAVCSVAGIEINRYMVENGWAVSYGRYGELEKAAARARRGIWAGSFERPKAWRAQHAGERGS